MTEAKEANSFLVDSARLSEKALERKHELENNPASRKSPLDYFPEMEQLDSTVEAEVLAEMEAYDV